VARRSTSLDYSSLLTALSCSRPRRSPLRSRATVVSETTSCRMLGLNRGRLIRRRRSDASASSMNSRPSCPSQCGSGPSTRSERAERAEPSAQPVFARPIEAASTPSSGRGSATAPDSWSARHGAVPARALELAQRSAEIPPISRNASDQRRVGPRAQVIPQLCWSGLLRGGVA
jgi:hypothetical protein